MSAGTVSIVLAVRDGSASLARTLGGLTGESIREILVVDDGSVDSTPRILEAARAREPRLRVVRSGGTGLTTSLALGCSMAVGEYIARQDCGDLSLPGRFDAQAAVLDAGKGTGFVSCHTRFVAPEGEELEVSDGGCPEGGLFHVQLGLEGHRSVGPSHHGSVMFRSNLYRAVGGYREAFRYAQDWDLWLRMGEHSAFAMVPRVLYEADVDPDGISMAKADQQRAYAKLAEKARGLRKEGLDDAALLAKGPELPHPSRRGPGGEYFIGSVLLEKGDGAARKYLMRAARKSPWHMPVWAKLCRAFFLSSTRIS